MTSECCDISRDGRDYRHVGTEAARRPLSQAVRPFVAQNSGRTVLNGRFKLMSDLMLGYIDPGSGSIVLQMLLGSALGLGLYFRQNLIRVFRLFRRSR